MPHPNFPLQKGIITKQAHVALPKGTVEEEHGRDGFFGPVSHLYRTHAPTGWSRIEGNLKPRAYWCNKLDNATIDKRVVVLENKDVAISVVKNQPSMDYFFRNADGDDVYFVHQGSGVLESDFGKLNYEQGDYLVIPRGTSYRFITESKESFFLIIESFSRITQPDRGLMGQHALYDPAVINTPEPAPQEDTSREWEVRIKRENDLTSVFYPYHPMDVVGWKGDLSVWQLNIRDIRPVMSHRYHLAPSVHSTFQANGFIICTFMPRPLEEDPEAVRVPFYHRNIDYDEVLFYHDGDFFSRDNIDAGMLTFHPQGIHHGPHPGAMKGSLTKERTDEKAVMVDTVNPLYPTSAFEAVEWAEYHMSWQEKP